MWLRRLDFQLFFPLCVCSSLKHFVTVYRLRFFIWHPHELLASNFVVSATTLEFGFSSPWRRAFTADCTMVSEHFLKLFSTNRWILLDTSQSLKYNKKWVDERSLAQVKAWYKHPPGLSQYSPFLHIPTSKYQYLRYWLWHFWTLEEGFENSDTDVEELQCHIERIQWLFYQ